jgi:threonine/homoserine/homoserine lactone efflux protein
MSLHGLAIFCLTYVIAVATPGPGIAALVSRVLSRGTHGLPAFIAGFVVGDLIWLTLAASGMAALAANAHTLFMVVKYLGALYLLYLAYRMWTAPARAVDDNVVMPEGERASRLFAGALALTLGNPKVIVFFLALLPTVIDLQEMTMSAFARIAAAICIILSGVLTMYTVAAIRSRRLFKNSRAVQWLNRGSGTVMAGAALAVAASRS